MNFRQAFKLKFGREASHADVLEFETNLRLLDTTPDDAILAVMLMLKYDREQFSKIPTKINEAAERAFKNEKSTLENDMLLAAKNAFGGLIETARDALINASKGVAEIEKEKAQIRIEASKANLAEENLKLQKKMVTWGAAGGIIAIALGLVGGFFWGQGSTAALEADLAATKAHAVALQAYNDTHTIAAVADATAKLKIEVAELKAANVWANSKDGRTAQALFNNSNDDFKNALYCSGKYYEQIAVRVGDNDKKTKWCQPLSGFLERARGWQIE